MTQYVFDTSALLTYIENEEGAIEVEDLLQKALNNEVVLYISIVSCIESFYISWQEQGENIANERLKLIDDLMIIAVQEKGLNAVAPDKKHIELKEPISPKVGENFKIAILPLLNERGQILERLRQAYLSMTDEEKSFELKMAEEGLAASPEIFIEGGEPEQWWE